MTTQQLVLAVLCFHLACVLSRQTEFLSDLNDLTDQIIEKHFGSIRCITYVFGESFEMVRRDRIPVLTFRLPTETEILRESFEQGCGGFVVRTKNKSDAARRLVEAKRSATGSRYNNERYLFLPTDQNDDDVELLNDGDMFYLPNLVVVAAGEGAWSLVTHTVFDHHRHDLLSIVSEVLDRWSPKDGFELGSNLYPDKLSNVYGRKFVFAVLNYSPFSLVRTNGNKTSFDGFETRIAAEFVRTVNGTWEGLDHPEELWGEIFPNGSATGIVGSVLEHRADFGFAAFYQWFCDECDCTYPLYQSGVTCLVPRPELVSGWLTIVLPFTTHTWVALILVYFLTSVFLAGLFLAIQSVRGLKVRDKIGMAASDSFFINFRLQLEQVPFVRKNEPLSVYVKIAVYYYFFVAAFWQGGISSILTVPRFESPINTVTDLIEHWPKVKWGANSDAWVNSIRASSDPNLVQIVKKFVVHDDDTLETKTKTRDFGFFVEKLPHGHYGYSDYIKEEGMKYLRLMEDNIYTAFGVLILPRGSPFSEKVDRTFLWLFDCGIIHKIEVQVSLERINNRLQNMIKFSNLKETNTVILELKHIEGPIYVFAGGMSMALFAFLLEIYHSRQKPKAKTPEKKE